MNILSAFFAWRERRRAERELIEAEKLRNITAKQEAYRKARKMEWKYLEGIKREATCRSLRASCTLMRASVGRRVS